MKSLTGALAALAIGAAIGVVAVVGIKAAATTDTFTTSNDSSVTDSQPAGSTAAPDVLAYGTNG